MKWKSLKIAREQRPNDLMMIHTECGYYTAMKARERYKYSLWFDDRVTDEIVLRRIAEISRGSIRKRKTNTMDSNKPKILTDAKTSEFVVKIHDKEPRREPEQSNPNRTIPNHEHKNKTVNFFFVFQVRYKISHNSYRDTFRKQRLTCADKIVQHCSNIGSVETVPLCIGSPCSFINLNAFFFFFF